MLTSYPVDGKFGKYGGKFVPETLMPALEELEIQYRRFGLDNDFRKELDHFLTRFAGRPTPLYHAKNLSKKIGGAKIVLKREDLLHGGAHKINNTIGQALLARGMGKRRIIAETGAGQHGVATAIACAALGLQAEIYMGAKDIERQKLNVFRMKLLGAKVISVHSGSKTLKDAINEAIRDWISNVKDTYYLLGSAVGPHPYPMIVRNFQCVIGEEIKRQSVEDFGRPPASIVACVGGGSNAIGSFYPFLEMADVKLYGVEAGGIGTRSGQHSASLCLGKDGVLHGMRSYLLQDRNGQIEETHSISAGLDYPGVGPEHAMLKDTGRAKYSSCTDREALRAFEALSATEGILPALESSHALAYAMKLAARQDPQKVIVVTLSGRGDKDVEIVQSYLKKEQNVSRKKLGRE